MAILMKGAVPLRERPLKSEWALSHLLFAHGRTVVPRRPGHHVPGISVDDLEEGGVLVVEERFPAPFQQICDCLRGAVAFKEDPLHIVLGVPPYLDSHGFLEVQLLHREELGAC